MYRLRKITAWWKREVNSSQKGTITIFLSIVFFAMIILTGLFVDIARIKIAQNQLRRAVNASARSVMADYNVKLRSTYGIFGTGRRDFGRDFEKYMRANLSTAKQQDLNLLDIRYESGNIVLFYPLSSNEVIKQQILETMKYKAPVETGRELINKFMQLRNAAAFFEQSNENRKSLNRINKKTKSLHEYNRNIKKYGSELEKSKAELKDVNSRLKSEKDPERIRKLTKKSKRLEKRIVRLRNNIEGELHKARRAGMEIELELKKIKESDSREVYKDKDSHNEKPNVGTLKEKAEVRKETQNRVDGVEKTLQGIKSDMASTTEALRKEINSNGAEHYIYSSMGIDSASKAYEQIKGYWNKTANPTPKEAEISNRSEELLRKHPEISRHFKKIPVTRSVKTFESTDAVKADKIAEFFGKVFEVINVDKKLEGARDEMYINEYILTYFSYLTSGAKGDITYPFTRTEAEYICFGKKAMSRTVSELYFTRFALDSAGYFAFTKGIPELTMRTIYSLGMGAIQASIDTVKMVALNEPVPVVSVQPDNPLQNVTLTYKDHLRLFLLLHSDEKTKLDRIKELIKARSSIESGDMYTNSAGAATISIRLWFLPITGLKNMEKGPFGSRVNNGRCYITKEVEFGY